MVMIGYKFRAKIIYMEVCGSPISHKNTLMCRVSDAKMPSSMNIPISAGKRDEHGKESVMISSAHYFPPIKICTALTKTKEL